MLLIKFWIISSLICLLIFWIKLKSLKAKYVRKYGEPKMKNYFTIWETIEPMLPILVPIVNILIVFILIFENESIRDKAVEQLREKILKLEQEN